MLTALAFAFIVFALAVALRSGSGSFDVSRERLRADARRPASVAAIYAVLGTPSSR